MKMRRFFLLASLSLLCYISYGQKMVMFEKFTNAFCGVCPDATLTIDAIVRENPNVIWVSHHKPISWGDNPLTNEVSAGIWNDLNIAGVPTGMIDRTLYSNSITIGRGSWEQIILSHLQIPTTFEISISDVEYDANNRDLNFSVAATALSDISSGPYRLTAYIVEDSVYGTGQHSYWNDTPWHPLEGLGDIIWNYPHRNVVRSLLEDQWGTPDVVPIEPETGVAYSHNYHYKLPVEYLAEKIKIVAMVALFDEENIFPGEVQNATQIKLQDLDLKLTSINHTTPFNFSIAPNPASDFLKINFETLPALVMVLDVNGKLVTQFIPENLETKIELNEYQSGSYYLVSEQEGKLFGSTFVVSK